MTAHRPAVAMAVLALALPSAALPGSIERGDALFDRRNLDPAAAKGAVRAYESAIEADPGAVAPRIALLRALHFVGEHQIDGPDEKRPIFRRGRDLADETLRLIGTEVGYDGELAEVPPEEARTAIGAHPFAAPAFFWSAIHWGLWAEVVGKLTAARQGVGGRIRDHAAVVVALDERFENAGGLRLLGRLHTEAPKIPLVTGWVDRDAAIDALERALAIAPEERGNRLFLADALLRFRRDEDERALALLDSVASAPIRRRQASEDRKLYAQAAELLRARGVEPPQPVLEAADEMEPVAATPAPVAPG